MRSALRLSKTSLGSELLACSSRFFLSVAAVFPSPPPPPAPFPPGGALSLYFARCSPAPSFSFHGASCPPASSSWGGSGARRRARWRRRRQQRRRLRRRRQRPASRAVPSVLRHDRLQHVRSLELRKPCPEQILVNVAVHEPNTVRRHVLGDVGERPRVVQNVCRELLRKPRHHRHQEPLGGRGPPERFFAAEVRVIFRGSLSRFGFLFLCTTWYSVSSLANFLWSFCPSLSMVSCLVISVVHIRSPTQESLRMAKDTESS